MNFDPKIIRLFIENNLNHLSLQIMKYKLIFFIINCILFSSDKPYLIIVSLDGYRYDYSDIVSTPNLDYIKKNGIKSKSLKPVFPSLTFPNHYSIATGCYSDDHKITGNIFFSKEYNEYYSYKNPATVQDGKYYGCEPMWVTLEKNKIKTATYFWIGSEAEIQGFRPSIYKKYNSTINYKSRIDSAMHWIDLPEDRSPQLIMLYFDQPDHSGHHYGPTSALTLNQIAKMDSLMGYLLLQIDKRKNDKKINLIVLSDHGMSDVDESKIVFIDEYLSIPNQYNFYGQGSFMQIEILESLLKLNIDEFETIPNIKYYFKNQIPLEFHFKNLNTQDILLVADEGYLIGLKKDKDNGIFKLKGMHGYDPENINMHGIFYAMGPHFKNNIEIETLENVQIYSLVCNFFNINSSSKSNNKNNFDFKNILK